MSPSSNSRGDDNKVMYMDFLLSVFSIKQDFIFTIVSHWINNVLSMVLSKVLGGFLGHLVGFLSVISYNQGRFIS
jgi:hypothetical protein